MIFNVHDKLYVLQYLLIRSSFHLESAVFQIRPALLNVFLKEEATSLYLRMQWIT
jgi:hypothetical protein